ncbi:MAG: hypothetical protein KatS3mg017_0189 [Fimbriimonadales bacterium]|nr:MAG: hypothetical protein KatS3mg017_0189 [Fimbriimonadales bacterium]
MPQIRIGENGAVFANGAPAGQLLIVQGDLLKDPDGYFTGAAQPLPNPRVAVGALEHSNVNMVREMVSMIELIRAYETNQRAILAHDETLGKAINELAKI